MRCDWLPIPSPLPPLMGPAALSAPPSGRGCNSPVGRSDGAAHQVPLGASVGHRHPATALPHARHGWAGQRAHAKWGPPPPTTPIYSQRYTDASQASLPATTSRIRPLPDAPGRLTASDCSQTCTAEDALGIFLWKRHSLANYSGNI